MSQKISIVRGKTRLGTLDEAEARELLGAGFLRPTDRFRPQGARNWRPLAELTPAPAASLIGSMKSRVLSAGAAVASVTSGVSRRIKVLAEAGTSGLKNSRARLLNDYLPQIRIILMKQVLDESVSKAQQAVHDDEFMRKVFGAAFDCLPKPIYRFVSEQQFIEFCLENRRKLLGTTPEDISQGSPPSSAPPGEA